MRYFNKAGIGALQLHRRIAVNSLTEGKLEVILSPCLKFFSYKNSQESLLNESKWLNR